MCLLALERLVDLGRGLPEQEQTAADEDHVPPRERVTGDGEGGLRQADDPGDRQQQGDAHAHGQEQADLASPVALTGRQPGDQDRDEDDVVDAEDDLEHGQREEGDPRLGIAEQGDEVHGVRGYRQPHGGAGKWQYDDSAMTAPRSSARSLPVLDPVAPAPVPAARVPASPIDERLIEYRPEVAAMPRFHVWTLGCQMNRSDSEEMAGRLLAVGCEESASFEGADLVVINTCAIREGAEQKVIGRQGHLARLKSANPGMRVVMTGCAVREAERDGLQRRFPAVDSSCDPTRSRSSSTAWARRRHRVPSVRSARRPGSVGRSSAPRTTCRRPAPARWGRGPSPAARRSAPGCPSSTAATRRAPTASCRSAAGPSGAGRSTTSWRKPEALAVAGYREVTLLGQNVNSYGHDLAPEARFAHVDAERWAGRRIDLHGRPDLAELIRAIDALRTADGRPAIPRLRFVTSHPWDLSDRLIAALADSPSVCEHLHLPVQSGDDAVLRRMGRQYTIEHYRERLDRIRDAVPGITVSTDVIVGFCGETEAQFESTRACSRKSGTTRSSPPPIRRGPARPRRGWPTTCRPTSSGAVSTSCSPSRSGSGSSATRPGSVARSTSSSTPWRRPAATTTTPRVRTQIPRDRSDARQQARPSGRRRAADRPRGPRPHRSRRSVRAPRVAHHRITTNGALTPGWRPITVQASGGVPSTDRPARRWCTASRATSHGRGGLAPWTIPGLISCVDRRRQSNWISSNRSPTAGSLDASSSSARRSSDSRCPRSAW